MDYVRILVNWVVCGHWCQLLNEYFQQIKSVDLNELRCVDISELCYLWSLVGFSVETENIVALFQFSFACFFDADGGGSRSHLPEQGFFLLPKIGRN